MVAGSTPWEGGQSRPDLEGAYAAGACHTAVVVDLDAEPGCIAGSGFEDVAAVAEMAAAGPHSSVAQALADQEAADSRQ